MTVTGLPGMSRGREKLRAMARSRARRYQPALASTYRRKVLIGLPPLLNGIRPATATGAGERPPPRGRPPARRLLGRLQPVDEPDARAVVLGRGVGIVCVGEARPDRLVVEPEIGRPVHEDDDGDVLHVDPV